MRKALSLVAIAVLSIELANAQTPVNECDRLAANPPDPDRVAPGVPRSAVDVPRAIAACKAAVERSPDVARFSYQLGRVLFYDGQTDSAIASFERAIDQDYRQARFLLGLIMTRGYDDVPDDICRVERLWRAAAQQSHTNAQVSYVDFALQGRFDSCRTVATREEMTRFLDAAATHMDYIGGLLVANLRRGLND